MKKQSFVTGAAILMVANAVSKILGAGFKIPLTYILREEGMAVYNTAFTVYVMFLALVVSGVPTAVSKSVARSDERGAFLIADTSEKVLAVLGTVAGAALYFGANFFACAMKEPGAAAAIRIISPSVLLVALGTGCKSFFHGSSGMITPAVSQVAEAVAKLVVGFVLAAALIKISSYAAAAGAIAGVTAGEFIATAILAGAYFAAHRKIKVLADREEKKRALKELLSVALPLLLADAVLNAVSMTDTSVLRVRMLAGGLSQEKARFLYGAYSGYAMTIFNLPVGILATIGVSLLPAVASASAAGDTKKASRALDSGVELALFVSVPSAVMMWLVPDKLLELLFHNSASALMLKFMAPCVVTVSLMQLLSAVIQACGNVILPSVFITCGLIVKIGIMWVLCAMPQYNIYGAVIASNVIYVLILAADIITVRVITGKMPHILRSLITPCVAAAAMAAAVKKELEYCGGSAAQTAAVCTCGACVYLVVIGIIGIIRGAARASRKNRAERKSGGFFT